MSTRLLKAVKPSDIETRREHCQTFGKHEKDQVGRNVIIVSERMGDDWRPFTADEYIKSCSHASAKNDVSYLEGFVQSGHMVKSGGRYSITDKFIAAVVDCIKD